MAISINFLANVRDFIRGTSSVEDSLHDVADSLDDVAADSQRAARKMADAQDDAARDIDRSNERLERSFRDLAEQQRKTSSQAGDELGDGMRRGTARASESVEEFSGEFKQNMAETFSSFRGDASDFAQIFQDTLGGLASGLSGVPAVAAVAAGAAGLGLVLGAIENGQAASEAWKQDVADLTQQFIDAGRRGPDALDAMVSKLQELASSTDSAGVGLSKLDDLTRRSGQSFEDVAQAYAGNTDALADLVKAGKERLEQLEREGAATDENNAKDRAAYAGTIDKANAQKDLNGYLEQASEKAQEAAKNAELYAQSGAAGMAAKAELIRNIDQSYDDAAGAVEDYVDAETGVFDVDKYISAMTEKAKALDGFKDNMQKAALTLSPDALQFLESQGTEAASQLVQSYLQTTGEKQQQLNAVWSTAGKTSADSYTAALRGNLPASVPGPKIVIDDVDTSRIPGMIQQTLNGHRFEVPVFATPKIGAAVG